MRSTAKHPLSFFDWYLENEINNELEKFYEKIHENESGRIENVDKTNHSVKVLDIHQEKESSEYITYKFEKFIKSKLSQEIKLTKNFLESGFEKRFSDKKEVKAYADFLRIKLNSYLNNKSLKEFPFLSKYFGQLEGLINQFSKPLINYSFVPSFILIASPNEEQHLKIKKLYNLLIEKPSIINCTENEFNKAFTGQEITEGIKWLVVGKNKKFTSKPSLLYFLDGLIENGFLSRSIILDLYKFIRYVFRDYKGNELKNLKQSRDSMTDNPTSKERIDTIISSL